MAFPFFPSISPQTDPEQVRGLLRRRFLDEQDPAGATAQYLMGLAAVPQHASTPEPRTVSGGSVIGLTPEQTNDLLNRVQTQNDMDQRIALEQNNARARSLENMGERIYRASEAEKNRAERAAEREAERRQPRYMSGPNGQITEITPGTNGQPASTATLQEGQDKPARYQQVEYEKTGPDGNPIRVFRTFDPTTGTLGDEQVLGNKPAHAGVGGGGTPSSIAYTIDTLRRQGMTPEMISKNFPTLAPYLAGASEDADRVKQKFIEQYVMRHGAEKQLEAEQAYAGIHGLPAPPPPLPKIADAAKASGLTDRKELGLFLISRGYAGPEIVQYLNSNGILQNLSWWDSVNDPNQWGNSGQPIPGAANTPTPPVTPPPAGAAPSAQPQGEMREKDGMKFMKNAEGKWVRVQ